MDPEACPFCEIVARDDPEAREVLRDDECVAFFPTEPATLGHTLVVPRRHVGDVSELEDDLACSLMAMTRRVAAAIRAAVAPDGLNIIQSNGEAASQTVPHLHVHVVPRWHGDALGRIWPPETSYAERRKDEAWHAIRSAADRPGP